MTPAAIAVIRPAALRNNLEVVRHAAPGCRVLAVVKANAYGHGLVAVAQILAGADGFAVARLEEARQLRDAGIARRIVLLGGCVDADEVAESVRLGLDLVIHDLDQVSLLEANPTLAPPDLWLKVDTGMGRLGIEPSELGAARDRLERWLAGRGRLRLMTHLASADVADDAATAGQLARFAPLGHDWSDDVSVANSAAILQWPASRPCAADTAGHCDWVRPGLMLYGVSPLPGRFAATLGLQPAMNFETRLIAVRNLPAGRCVGYGGDWRATRDSVVGVAAAGYADGYPWHLPTQTEVLVNGQRAPVVGRVSMDMVSIDLTDLPRPRPGDRVVLWGERLPVEEVAARAGTIPYELLAGMSPRVVRQLEA